MSNELPPLPEPAARIDQDDDNNTWGALQENVWDSDYSLKLNAPLFTAEQMQEYARAAVQAERADRKLFGVLVELDGEYEVWIRKVTP